MSVFPVAEPHNIGYDAASCGTGTCQVSCPDVHANSDWGGAHHGVDVFARRGAPLVAVADGTIVAVGVPSSTSGLRVRLRDRCGWEYYYGHLDGASVQSGQSVHAGQLIGSMGNSGTSGVHVHFNVSPDGGYYNDINPFQLLVATSPTACSAAPPPPPPPPSTPPTAPQHGCGIFGPNEVLAAGQSMPACNGAYTLQHQTDGNVVLYNAASGAPVWSTGTYGQATAALIIQGDGNLVLYSAAGTPLWSSNTSGQNNAVAVVQDDGNLVVYAAGLRAVWSTDTSNAGTPGCGSLGTDAGLGVNQAIWSCNGRYLFAHQGDGNVVLYNHRNAQPLWDSRTSGRASQVLAMQGDGNLVLYAPGGVPLWSSGTSGRGAGTLAIQDDGNVVIYTGAGAVWSTGTAGR